VKHGEYPNPAPRERDINGRNYSLEIFILGLAALPDSPGLELEQNVAGASKLEEVQP
jgi:hypothetical protein